MSDPRPGLVVRERYVTVHPPPPGAAMDARTEEVWWRVIAVVPRDAPLAIARDSDKLCAIGLIGLGSVLIVDRPVMEVHEHLAGGLPTMDVTRGVFDDKW